MAHPDRTRITDVREQAAISTPERYQVQAHPVDQLVAPERNDQLIGLAQGLKDFQPGVNKYLGMLQERKDAEDYAKGQLARVQAGGAEVKPVLTTDQTFAYQQGFMQQHGQILGQDAGLKMQQYHEEHKNIPGYDPQQAIDLTKGQDLVGMEHFPEAMKGYIHGVSSGEQRIRQDFVQTTTEQVRQQRRTQFSQLVADNMENANSPAEAQAGLQSLRQQGAALNITNDEMSKMAVDSAIARSLEKGPGELSFLKIPDASGMSVYKSNPELAQKIDAAEHIATTRESERISKATQHERLKQQMQFDEDMKQGNLLPYGDPRRWIDDHTGPGQVFETEHAAAAAYRQALEAKHIADGKGPFIDYSATFEDASAHGRMAASRDKKEYEAQLQPFYDNLIAGIDWNDGKSVETTLNRIRQIHANTGVASKQFEGLLQNAESLPSAEIKGPLPPAVKLTTELYRNYMEKEPNLLKGVVSDDARITLGAYLRNKRAGMPDDEAWNNAKARATPEAKARVEFAVNPETIKKVSDNVASQFNEWTNVDFLDNRYDTSRVKEFAVQSYRDAIANGATQEQAQEDALNAAKQHFVLITQPSKRFGLAYNQQTYLEMPDRLPSGEMASPKDLQTGTQAYLEKRAAHDNRDMSYYQLHLTPDHQNYYIKDQSGHLVEGEAVIPATSLIEIGREAQLTNMPHVMVQNEMLQKMAGVKPTITDKEIYDNLPDIEKALEGGGGWRVVRPDLRVRINAIRKMKQGEDIARAVSNAWVSNKEMDYYFGPAPGSLDSSVGWQPQRHLNANVDGRTDPRNMRSQDYMAKEPDLSTSLTGWAEGLKTHIYQDPARGAGDNIGYGYNIGLKKPEQVAEDFRRAGITNKDDVLAGKGDITEEQSRRLLKISLEDARTKARNAIGTAEFDRLPERGKAVLTDLAYCTKDITEFQQTMDYMKKGDWKGLSENITLSYMDSKTNRRVQNERRLGAYKAIIAGDANWRSHVEASRQSTPK